MTVVLVTGSRHMTDVDHMSRVLQWVEKVLGPIDAVWTGAAPGADTLAIQVARENGWPTREFPADWDTYNKSAGPRRNKEMVKALVAQQIRPLVVAFPMPPRSDGTRHCMTEAWLNHVPVFVFPLRDKG